jgi:hypothetical protein
VNRRLAALVTALLAAIVLLWVDVALGGVSPQAYAAQAATVGFVALLSYAAAIERRHEDRPDDYG